VYWLDPSHLPEIVGVHSKACAISVTSISGFRMIAILGKLDEDVEVKVIFQHRQHGTHDAPSDASSRREECV
jgi:hypothetical protein